MLHSGLLLHPVDVAAWPAKIDGSRQLFIDDYLIAERRGLRRQWHQPRKHSANPVLVGETLWEGGRRYGPVLAYCLRDETAHRFRLWYRSRITYQEDGRTYSFPNLYAESADGIHWQQAALLIPYGPRGRLRRWGRAFGRAGRSWARSTRPCPARTKDRNLVDITSRKRLNLSGLIHPPPCLSGRQA